MNGGSYTASFLMLRPFAAARSARIAPDDIENTNADRPARLIMVSRSSISRSTAYGLVSPLSPRPRRSYAYTMKLDARSGANFSVGPKFRLQNAPSNNMIGGPLPILS